jgi:hypothetical protein
MRVRREIRSLQASEWKAVVDAFWVIKRLSSTDGRNLYGESFISYNDLVDKHMAAAMNREGDLAHFSPHFFVWHRLWLLELEDSLLSVDPTIKGLPYWDYSQDKQGKCIFSEKYLGNSTGRPGDFAVADGQFKLWPIQKIDNSNIEQTLGISNVFGYQRSPISVEKTPYITRHGGSMCGSKVGLGSIRNFEKCLNAGPNIIDYLACIDPTVHGIAHSAVGGSFKRRSQKNSVDSPFCTQWYGYISPPNFPEDYQVPDNW